MTNDDLFLLAVRKTIEIMAEVGIKYRKKDFTRKNGTYIDGFFYNPTCEITMSGTITLKAWFDEGERGKKLKKMKEKFFNYFNCRVFDNYVRFRFTKKELELEYVKQEDVDANKMEQIMAKIQKLLALSESDNEHEAISASLMAQKLLAKYNIDLEAVTGIAEEQEIEEVRADVGTGNKWKYRLSNVVANNYRCKNYYHGADVIVFHGYRQDIVIARRVYMYLFSVCKRLGRAYVKKIKETEDRWSMDGVYNSFCDGFINGVNTELSKQCTELMIVTPQAVIEEYEQFSAKFGQKDTSVQVNDYGAYKEGEIEGKRALNAQYVDDNSKYIED